MSTIHNCSSAIKFPELVNVWPTFVAKMLLFWFERKQARRKKRNASFPHQPY